MIEKIKNSVAQHKFNELNKTCLEGETRFYIDCKDPFNYGVIVNIKDFKTEHEYNKIIKKVKKQNHDRIKQLQYIYDFLTIKQ